MRILESSRGTVAPISMSSLILNVAYKPLLEMFTFSLCMVSFLIKGRFACSAIYRDSLSNLLADNDDRDESVSAIAVQNVLSW